MINIGFFFIKKCSPVYIWYIQQKEKEKCTYGITSIIY